ncbi:sensor histidine kinase [Actinomadura atramentaria]|uniref:sensor histidine kinase n=1 Tax=Actinomadura atramentaria TaxID=1990 RepID=UPI00036F5DC5|nr:sensor histidine kinase [Actinomadura atramentaria]
MSEPDTDPVPPPPTTRPAAPFSHRLLPYDDAGELLAAAVPFLRGGLRAADRVVAVTGLATRVLLQGELGAAADRVEFRDAASWYAHPARTFASALADADAEAGRGGRLRLLAEPAWTRRPDGEVREWQRAEAICNVAFARTGAAILCPYPVRSTPPAVVADARRTHPETVRGERAVPTPGYLEPHAYNDRCDSEPLPLPPASADALSIARPDLYWIRAYVSDWARRVARTPDEPLQRLLVAVTEVVTNAERHGSPPITLRMWTEPGGACVCEISDGGRWPEESWYGFVPPPPGVPGRLGLWAVRLLCSRVDIRTGAAGTTVRLTVENAHGGSRTGARARSARADPRLN